MQINVASLLKEHTGATREYAIDEEVAMDGDRRRVRGDVRLDRTPRGILVRGRLSAEAPMECSRCLKPLLVAVAMDIEEVFLPSVDIDTGQRVEPGEGDEEAYRITPRHVLDLSQAVRDYWTMALPMAPVCDESCGGICPVCGEDAGAPDHGCAREQIDARWAKLAELASRQ
jgi:uncharacterized protein